MRKRVIGAISLEREEMQAANQCKARENTQSIQSKFRGDVKPTQCAGKYAFCDKRGKTSNHCYDWAGKVMVGLGFHVIGRH